MRPRYNQEYSEKPKRRFGRDSEEREFRKGPPRERYGGFSRNRREMHEITCARCGEISEVPFKPKTDRVYCRKCFSQKERNEGGKDEILQQINSKLDRILKALNAP